MIGTLRGRVVISALNKVTLDVGGVGYILNISDRDLRQISAGKEVMFFTELIVREDKWRLFGFLAEDDLICFGRLVKINGVSGRIAMILLSHFDAGGIYAAAAAGNSLQIAAAKGIGTKLAGRIVEEMGSYHDALLSCALPNAINIQSDVDIFVKEATEALIALGYGSVETVKAVEVVVAESSSETLSTEDLFKKAISILSDTG